MKKLLIPFLSLFVCWGVSAQSLSDALAAVEAEQYEKAEVIFKKLVADNPDDGRYNFYLGELYMIHGETALARACFEKGLTANKNNTINNIGLGRLLLDDGKPAEAEAAFAKATEKLRKKDTEEYLYIAKAYLKSFNPDYTKAVEYANKVVAANPSSAEGYITLGDAEYKLDHLNEAYMAYRNAYELNDQLYRAKLNLAVITKDARAFPEAVKALEEIAALAPDYGPTYRELAEVYYLWGTFDKGSYDIDKALKYYEQYMSLTDYSLDSRMRHADFLVLAKDYESLQREAAEMRKIDNVNPRILRYLGYSAYENGNYTEAIEALNSFMDKVDPRRVLGIDYAYLAKSQLKLIEAEDVIDSVMLDDMLVNLHKAVEMDAPIDVEFSAFATQLYKGDRENGKSPDYMNAAKVFGVLSSAPQANLLDQLYFANAVFYAVVNLPEEARAPYMSMMEQADTTYVKVIEGSPTTQDAYLNRARLNRFLPGGEEKMAGLYEDYIRIVMEKGEAETSKPLTRTKLGEAYTSLGAYYAESDTPKAIEYFKKALEYEPENEHARQSLEFLQK